MHMDARVTVVPPDVDHVLEGLRTLDRLGPRDIARVLPELEHARARLWLLMLMSNQPSQKAPAEPAQNLLTVKEAAAHLGCSTGHVYELVRSGGLRSIRDGRAIRITREALAAWRAAHEANQLDGNVPGSGESLLHDELHAKAACRPLRPERAVGRRDRSPMRQNG